MPTYEFKCDNCGHHFEEFLPVSRISSVKCPICGHHASNKISGGIGLIFKGHGFYATDYRKPSGRGGKIEK